MDVPEFSHQMANLTANAARLNAASDSINELIARLQTTLRSLNVGLEVWVTKDELATETWIAQNRDDEDYERGVIDTELGFAQLRGQWVIVTRRAYYDHGAEGFDNVWSFVRAEDVTSLLEAPRHTRIEALKHFPALIDSLNKAAKQAIAAIDGAKQFVK